jgi:hypothetical protein
VFRARTCCAERKCLCGATNLKMAERHRMMIQRNTEASGTDEDCVIVYGLIREDRRVKFRETAVLTDIALEISYLNFRKVSARWVPKMPTRCTETKE